MSFFLWAFLIFFTSCFVVFTPEFFRGVAHVFPTKKSEDAFEAFWLVGGLVVVKGWHATEYVILDLLALRWAVSRWPVGRSIVLALLFSIVFAALDEWHQTFVPGRDGNVRDVWIDTAGASIAAAVQVVRHKRAQAPRPSS